MRRPKAVLWLALALALWPLAPARAGPWPREAGAVFLSFGGNLALSDGAERPVHEDPELYLEYGLTDRITLGVSAHTADAGAARVALSFVRVPLRPPERGPPISVSLWYGTRLSPEVGTERIGRLGLHFGWPIDRGWIAIDGYHDRIAPSGETETKIDLTWGRRLWPEASLMLQLQTGEGRAGDRYAKVAPSVIWHLSERVDLRAGVVQGLTGDRGTGLSAGLWLRF